MEHLEPQKDPYGQSHIEDSPMWILAAEHDLFLFLLPTKEVGDTFDDSFSSLFLSDIDERIICPIPPSFFSSRLRQTKRRNPRLFRTCRRRALSLTSRGEREGGRSKHRWVLRLTKHFKKHVRSRRNPWEPNILYCSSFFFLQTPSRRRPLPTHDFGCDVRSDAPGKEGTRSLPPFPSSYSLCELSCQRWKTRLRLSCPSFPPSFSFFGNDTHRCEGWERGRSEIPTFNTVLKYRCSLSVAEGFFSPMVHWRQYEDGTIVESHLRRLLNIPSAEGRGEREAWGRRLHPMISEDLPPTRSKNPGSKPKVFLGGRRNQGSPQHILDKGFILILILSPRRHPVIEISSRRRQKRGRREGDPT